MGTEVSGAQSKSRVVVLITALNLILLGWLLYVTFGKALAVGGGTSLVLINETGSPMIDMNLAYPGGGFSVPRVEPGVQIGNPARNPGEFEATLTFKDEAGHAYRETFPVKPLDEFHINVHILPILEPSLIKNPDGVEEKVFKATPSKVRVLTTYVGETEV